MKGDALPEHMRKAIEYGCAAIFQIGISSDRLEPFASWLYEHESTKRHEAGHVLGALGRRAHIKAASALSPTASRLQGKLVSGVVITDGSEATLESIPVHSLACVCVDMMCGAAAEIYFNPCARLLGGTEDDYRCMETIAKFLDDKGIYQRLWFQDAAWEAACRFVSCPNVSKMIESAYEVFDQELYDEPPNGVSHDDFVRAIGSERVEAVPAYFQAAISVAFTNQRLEPPTFS